MGCGASGAKKYSETPAAGSGASAENKHGATTTTVAVAEARPKVRTSLQEAHDASATHVAIIGAGFVGTCTAYAMLCKSTAAKITMTDVNQEKCEGEVLDLEDGYGHVQVKMATPAEAGQADIIVITAGDAQKEGETRLELVKANIAIMKSIIRGMQPIKLTAKIVVVSNPCDALTFVAQEESGLPVSQVFGSGTVLDSMRLKVALANRIDVSPQSVTMYVLGEHGDSQFPLASQGHIGGVPLMECKRMQSVNLVEEAKKSADKAYTIIRKKGYTAFGIARAVEDIVKCIIQDRHAVLPVSVRVPDQNCCLSLPSVIGYNGVVRTLEHVVDYMNVTERALYQESIKSMQKTLGTTPAKTEAQQQSVVRAFEKGEVAVEDVAEPQEEESPEPATTQHLVAPTHVAVVGAGFVGTCAAFAMLCNGTAARLTLTDVNTDKCEGEVLDLQDGGGRVEVATPQEAGQADVIVITAGRGQKPGETRLELLKANAGIMRSIIKGMQPLKPTAKIIVVSNPCDALTYVAQECSGLPITQVFGSGTVLDSRRLRVALSQRLGIHAEHITIYALGEHGDSQFPIASLAKAGGVPLMQCQNMKSVDLMAEAKQSAGKAYTIIGKKGYTAFGVGLAVDTIVDAVVNNKESVLPVSVRVPNKKCCLSLPCVVGIGGINRVLEHVTTHFSMREQNLYDQSVSAMEQAVASLE